MSFYTELKRRNVFRVGAAYAVAAWLLIQIADTTFPLFGFGDKPARIIVILLIIAFIPSLIFAWAFELTPSGLQREEDVDHSLTVTTGAAKRLDRIIMFVLVLALGFFAFDKFVLSESREQAIAESARLEALAETVEAYKNNKSIAVLPFVDMSPNQDQEYFGDGIAEELLDQLTRLEGLNVASRTSSFAFKGSDQTTRSIAEELGVTSVLEGSVRKADDELRVTAQLIDARSDTHLWSKTFNRRIEDIFYIQEDIAESVAAALSIALDIEARDHLPGTGTDKIEAYDTFLAGRAWGRIGQGQHAEPYYRRATEIDPNYGEAWSELGGVIAGKSHEQPHEQARESQKRGRELQLHAIALNPRLAAGWRRLGALNRVLGQWVEAVEAAQTAATLAPGDIGTQLQAAGIFGALGHVRKSLESQELLQQIRPPGYINAQVMAENYIHAGQYDDARTALEISEGFTSKTNPSTLKRRLFIALSERDPAAIREFLGKYADADPADAPMIRSVLAEFDSSPDSVLSVLRRNFDDEIEMTGEASVITAGLATYYGDPEFALEVMTKELRGNLVRIRRLWYPFFSDMRKLPKFKAFVDELGLPTFWRTYGWPDYCRPLRNDDFECF